MQMKADLRGIKLKYEIGPKVPEIFYSDPRRLK